VYRRRYTEFVSKTLQQDEEVLAALADETASAILRKSARLPEREKEIVLGIVRQFGSQIDNA
jgi:DNA-binding transcriptional ArsR family regulator